MEEKFIETFPLSEKDFYDAGIYDAWQFVINTCKTIYTVEYCKNTILSLFEMQVNKHEKFLSEMYKSMRMGRSFSCSNEDISGQTVTIIDKEIDAYFLLDKLIKDFFQYSRNVFDSIAQIANSGCLAFNKIKVEKVDFPEMHKQFNKESYAEIFPKMKEWFNQIKEKDEFKYIDAFCNRTKHTCDVTMSMSLAIWGGESNVKIGSFVKKENPYDKKDAVEYLSRVYDFIDNSFISFIEVLKDEISKKTFVKDRYHKLCVFQYKTKDTLQEDYSVVYIETDKNTLELPEEIEVLLLHEDENGTILSKNCDIDTIYVRSTEKNREYIGKYVAKSNIMIQDALLQYRRYRKQRVDLSAEPIILDIINEWNKTKKFYHANRFMDIITVSDDEAFKKRVRLPF